MKNIFRDPEFWAILVFNLLLLYAFVQDITGFDTIVVLFFFQNLFIGLQFFIRLIVAGFRTFGLSWLKVFNLPLFFGFGFGLFHFVYSIFLITIVNKIPGPLDFKIIYASLLFMAGNMLFSLISDIRKDSSDSPSGSLLFFFPFIRVLPMHIFILFAFRAAAKDDSDKMFQALLVFIALKTLADIVMHVVLNRTWQQRRPPVIAGKI